MNFSGLPPTLLGVNYVWNLLPLGAAPKLLTFDATHARKESDRTIVKLTAEPIPVVQYPVTLQIHFVSENVPDVPGNHNLEALPNGVTSKRPAPCRYRPSVTVPTGDTDATATRACIGQVEQGYRG